MKRRAQLGFLFGTASLFLGLQHVQGAVFNIANGDVTALRNAITTANTNGQADTINLATGGLYLLTAPNGGSGQNGLPTIQADVAAPGTDLTINGNGATIQRSYDNGIPDFRLLQTNANVVMNDLTIENGKLPLNGSGAGILQSLNTLVLNTKLTLTNCSFIANTAGTSGGGSGGAIYNERAVLLMESCTFEHNTAGYRGGAVLNTTDTGAYEAFVRATDCTFANNNADPSGPSGAGGAICNVGLYNFVACENCTFLSNTAGSAGGAIYHVADPVNNTPLELLNCTFTANSALGGGAIYTANNSQNPFVMLSVQNCTFSDNNTDSASYATGIDESTGTSGGIMTVTLSNTIFKGNGLGPNLRRGSGATMTSIGHNLSSDAAGGGSGTAPGGYLNGAGDIRNTDPRFGDFGNNGGLTQTLALLSSSPAINAGDDAYSPGFDQRGYSRSGVSDIGAFEFNGVPQTLIVTTTDDHDDGVCDASDCTLREAINAANGQVGAELITFRPTVIGTIQLTDSLPNLTSMTLRGPGANLLTVRRNTLPVYRIFTIIKNSVNISSLTIANGSAPPSGDFPAGSGGGILSVRGKLFLSNCVVSGNSTANGFMYGGGIFNDEGTLDVVNCTFSGNNAYYGGGVCNNVVGNTTAPVTLSSSTFVGNTAPNGYGGGFYNAAVNFSTAQATASNCTFSNNSANNGLGGAIYNSGVALGTSSMAVVNCTLSGNSASNGGAIYSYNMNGFVSVPLTNDIFKSGPGGAQNLAYTGTGMYSNGHNLSDDGGSSILFSSGDQTFVDPMLGPLANNGGPTQTHALLAGSPAINAGTNDYGPQTDQRGYVRNGIKDIGAFESDGVVLRIISIVRSGNNIVITFDAVQDRNYRLERKHAITDAVWETIPGVADLIPVSTGPAQFTDPGAVSLGKAFYRVRLEP